MLKDIILFAFLTIFTLKTSAFAENCGKNEEYKKQSECEPSCGLRNPLPCDEKYGCYCKEGFIRKGKQRKCVRKEGCKDRKPRQVFDGLDGSYSSGGVNNRGESYDLGNLEGSVSSKGSDASGVAKGPDSKIVINAGGDIGEFYGKILALPASIISQVIYNVSNLISSVFEIDINTISTVLTVDKNVISKIVFSIQGLIEFIIETNKNIIHNNIKTVIKFRKGYINFIQKRIRLVKNFIHKILKTESQIPRKILNIYGQILDHNKMVFNELLTRIGYKVDDVNSMINKGRKHMTNMIISIQEKMQYEIEQIKSGVQNGMQTGNNMLKGALPGPIMQMI